MLVFSVRDLIAKAYSSDPQIQALTEKVLLIVSIGFFFDGLQGFFQGPIRAIGLQKWASLLTIFCYYGVGIPLSCLLAFKKEMGVVGLQLGVGIAMVCQFSVYLVTLMRSDWDQKAREVQKRIKHEKEMSIIADCEMTINPEKTMNFDETQAIKMNETLTDEF